MDILNAFLDAARLSQALWPPSPQQRCRGRRGRREAKLPATEILCSHRLSGSGAEHMKNMVRFPLVDIHPEWSLPGQVPGGVAVCRGK